MFKNLMLKKYARKFATNKLKFKYLDSVQVLKENYEDLFEIQMYVDKINIATHFGGTIETTEINNNNFNKRQAVMNEIYQELSLNYNISINEDKINFHVHQIMSKETQTIATLINKMFMDLNRNMEYACSLENRICIINRKLKRYDFGDINIDDSILHNPEISNRLLLVKKYYNLREIRFICKRTQPVILKFFAVELEKELIMIKTQIVINIDTLHKLQKYFHTK